MVNIYIIKSPIKGDEILFKELYYFDNKYALSNEGIISKKNGDSIQCKWGIDSSDKPLGDKVMFPAYGLAVTSSLIQTLRKFAPHNTINKLVIDGKDSDFVLLQPKNYDVNATQLEHIFMMFSKHKGLLVTQYFKDEWERLNLTGAEFVKVDVMDDDWFIKLPERV